MKPLKLTALLLLFPIVFFGQTLTGLWSGVMTNDSSTIRKDVSLEIALTEYRGKVYGYSCSEFIINDTLYYIVKRVKGTIEGDVCEVKDDEIVSYNFHGKLDKGVKVIHTFRMNKGDSSWHLEGGWKTNTTKRYYSLSGKTTLKEEKDMANSKLFPHLEELSLASDVPFYKEQKKEKEFLTTTKPTETSTAKNVNFSKTEVAAKNKTSLTAIENTDENKKDNAETEIVFAQRKKESPVTTVPAEAKKTDPLINNSIRTNKPTIVEQKPPVIAKENNPIATPQPEQKNTTPVATTQTETKKAVPSNNNTIEIKKDQPAITSNSNIAPKKEINSNTAIVENKKEPSAIVSNNNIPNQKKEVIIAPVQTEINKVEASVAFVQVDEKKQPVASNLNQEDKKPDPVFSSAATFAAERKSEKTQTVFFKSDSLELVLYDNGEVDGDTVSVLMNGKVIIAKQCLKAVAYKKTIYIPHDSNDSTVLVLYAENLGKYPPNTGLLIVHDGDDSYNVRFSADLQTNAAIILRRKNK